MSEKRFVVRKITRDERPKLFSSVGADYKYFIVDTKRHNTGEKWFDLELRFNFGIDSILADKVCELLNSLSEENERLKTEVEHWKHQCKRLLESHSDYDEDLGICCMCENLEGCYIEQYHEAEYHCKINGFKVERQKRLCEKFQIK